MGLVYVQGALPCFETFGNLPTDLVREDGLVGGCAASDVLDMIIIPGGSIVESQSIGKPLETEIFKMADHGKLVLGVCSGFQILSKGTDIGRLSPTPIRKPGLGLLDVEFKPLICTDQVKATIATTNRLTDALGAEVSGFHCHTYGEITVQKNAKTFLISHVKRLNYGRQQQDIVSGASNCGGNVVGVLPHALLDRNPVLIEGITKSLGIDRNRTSKYSTGKRKIAGINEGRSGNFNPDLSQKQSGL